MLRKVAFTMCPVKDPDGNAIIPHKLKSEI